MAAGAGTETGSSRSGVTAMENMEVAAGERRKYQEIL